MREVKIFSDGDASVIKCAIEDAVKYNRLIVSSEMVPDCTHQPEDVRIASEKIMLFDALRIRLGRNRLNRRRISRLKKQNRPNGTPGRVSNNAAGTDVDA